MFDLFYPRRRLPGESYEERMAYLNKVEDTLIASLRYAAVALAVFAGFGLFYEALCLGI